MPFLIAAKPLILSSLRAFCTAAIQGDALPRRWFFLLTTLPFLFCTRSDFFNPDLDLSILPKKRDAWKGVQRWASSSWPSLPSWQPWLSLPSLPWPSRRTEVGIRNRADH